MPTEFIQFTKGTLQMDDFFKKCQEQKDDVQERFRVEGLEEALSPMELLKRFSEKEASGKELSIYEKKARGRAIVRNMSEVERKWKAADKSLESIESIEREHGVHFMRPNDEI